MEDKLPELDSLKVNKRSGWPAIIGGIIGGLVGLVILRSGQSITFSVINLVIVGTIIGVLYGRIFFGRKLKAIVIGGIVGGIFGLNAISLGVFIFGALYVFLNIALSNVYDIDIWGVWDNWNDWGWSSGWWCFLYGMIIWSAMSILFRILGFYNISSSPGDMDWYKQFATVVSIPIIGTLLMFILYLNIVLGCIAGGIIGWGIYEQLKYWISMPLFAVPLFSFLGYLAGCKIIKDKKLLEEPIKEIPEGGLLMAEDPVFPKDVNKDISPVAFSEKAMIHDLLRALDNKSLLLTKLQSWGARARGQDQLRAFEMIREMLVKETDIIKAYTANQQARLDFENLKQFSQYFQKEKLKAQLAEEKYKQAEIEEKMKRMRLEGEYNSLTLQRKIEGLKKTREATESKIERIKKEQLEKIDFQEELKKVKTRKLADRVEYLYNRKKEIRKKYSPEEAEEIIDELDRTMVEEGLKEE